MTCLKLRVCSILASTLLCVLAACGGGGGGGDGTGGIGGGGGGGTSTTATYAAVLTGGQRPLPGDSSASGFGTVTVDLATRALSGSVTVYGMTAAAVKVHYGAAIVVSLTQTSPGVWAIPASTILSQTHFDSLRMESLYIDAHVAGDENGLAGGNAMGYLLRPKPLSGAQVVPPVTTGASGQGTFVDMSGWSSNGVGGGVATTGIVGTAAHIHRSTDNTVAVTLVETPAGSGVWVIPAYTFLSQTDLALYEAGNLYFNVHSAAYPNGEIRGAITP